MSTAEPAAAAACPNCGRSFAAEVLDAHGWCPRCREELVRRASVWARLAAGAFAVLYLVLLAVFGGFVSRFMIVWLALGALLGLAVFKLSRRAAFDVLRSRGIPANRG